MAEKDVTLEKLSAWKAESENLRSAKDTRIAKNLKLFKGIFREETPTSKVRGRQKTFFRKIWATIWRLTATMYQAFMKDPETFHIEGRDTDDDPRKAKVLQKIVQYRKDLMDSKDNLFLRFIWAIQAIFVNGWVCGKLTWIYNEETGEDRPKAMIYPFEQVFPDLVAETDDEMRYITFLNYLTNTDLEEMGIKPPQTPPSAPESNEIRTVRYQDDIDPANYDNTTVSYATPFGGNYTKNGPNSNTDNDYVTRYKIYESFWREDGKIMYGISRDFDEWLEEPKESSYGDRFPIFTGQCLTEMHKLLGEGLPEPLEGPQESYNYNLNMRKDNIAVAMTGHTFVARHAGVDLASLNNRRTSGYTMTDDINAIKHEQMPDVTSQAYNEAYADDNMMDDMSGVNKTISGQQDPGIKATTAQLNQTNSSAKIDLYVGIVGSTFFKSFHAELARQVVMFEEDETIFRIANEKLRIEENDPEGMEVYDIDIDMDCKINVDPSAVGQGLHTQQLIMAMDRGIATLQTVPALAANGMIPDEGLAVPNVSKIYVDLIKNIGLKNYKDYVIMLPKPEQPPEGGGVGSPPAQGGSSMADVGTQLVQRGSNGGM